MIDKTSNIKKTMCHPHINVWVCNRHLFLGCSEIKTSKLHPLIKISGLISDIKKVPIKLDVRFDIIRDKENIIKLRDIRYDR